MLDFYLGFAALFALVLAAVALLPSFWEGMKSAARAWGAQTRRRKRDGPWYRPVACRKRDFRLMPFFMHGAFVRL